MNEFLNECDMMNDSTERNIMNCKYITIEMYVVNILDSSVMFCFIDEWDSFEGM